MKNPLAKLALFFAGVFTLLMLGLWWFGAGLLLVVPCAVLAVVLFIASRGDLDSERGNEPVAVIIDPATGMPDFEGYRPRESELPQEQPAAELIEYEVAGESADEILQAAIRRHQEAEKRA